MGEDQLIGGSNYTIEIDITNNIFDNKSSFSSYSQTIPYCFTQEDLKKNYVGLINLYSLLNKKLSKEIFENNDVLKN